MILITGGLGYLGGRIAKRMIKLGLPVRIASSRENASVPFLLSSCEIVVIDLLDSDSLERACEGISIIVHLAALNARECERSPESALLVNGLGTLKLLQAAKKEMVSRFLYFSTIHVYGSSLTSQIAETVLPRPIHHYAITHRLAEDYVLEANQYGKMSTAVVRLSNAIGPPIDNKVNCWMLVVNDLCQQAVKSQNLILNSSGKQQRDFIPITDICHAIEFFKELPDKQFNGEIFNLGGETYTIYQIAQKIKERCHILFGWNVTIERDKITDEEVTLNDLYYNIEKMTKLGFKPLNKFDAEIDLLLQFVLNKTN
jgi:UDP-glucose 4-epimerase